MREILGAYAKHLPTVAFERRELEFIGKEGIFGAEMLKIGIIGEGIGLEHPGLPEEKSLD